MSDAARTGPAYVAGGLLAWGAAGALGFLAGRAVPGDGNSGRALAWLVGLPLAVAAGAALERGLRARLAPGTRWIHRLDAGVLWALSSAAGWGIDVRVGGPLSGLATAAMLAPPGAPGTWTWRRAAIAGLAMGGLFQLAGGRDLPLAWLGASAAVLVGALASLSREPEGRAVRASVVSLALGWAAAWVAAYLVTGRVTLPDLGGYGGTGAEVVLAYVLGAAATWLLARDGRLAAALAAGGVVAAGVGVGVDVVLRAVRAAVSGPAGWDHFHLALTQTLGMGVAAILAAGARRTSAPGGAGREQPEHEVRGGA